MLLKPLRKLEPGITNPRLQQLLGPAALLLHPFYGLLLLLLGCLALLPAASQPLGVALAGLSTYLLLMAVRLEQDWLKITPLPPLTVLCLGSWLHCGLGGGLIALNPNEPIPGSLGGMWRHLPEAQMLWIIFCASNIAIFTIIRTRKKDLPGEINVIREQPLTMISLSCGFFALGLVLIGFLSGTLDRSPENYLHWVAQRWRPDSLLVMFARFRDIFFIVAPIAICKAPRAWQKLTILLIFTSYIALSAPMGGRGLILWPLVYACLGAWLTPINGRALRALLLVVISTCLVLLPVIQSYKVKLQSIPPHQSDFRGKAKAFLIASSEMSQNIFAKSPVILGDLGRPLYGCIDGLLFQPPASLRPRAGWHRMESIFTAWIPELLVHKKIPLRDAHLIAAEAGGATREKAESMVYTSHDCVTYGGDLYWRGGWSVVLLGSLLFAIFYRLASSAWYRYAGWSSGWRIMLLLYPATFLTVYPAGSIGETAWLWMWDLPKYIILIGLICYISNQFFRNPTTNS